MITCIIRRKAARFELVGLIEQGDLAPWALDTYDREQGPT